MGVTLAQPETDYAPDFVVTHPLWGARMVVEVLGWPLDGPLDEQRDWQRLMEYQRWSKAPYALLFSPEKAYLAHPDGNIQEIDAPAVMADYGWTSPPRSFNAKFLTESFVETGSRSLR